MAGNRERRFVERRETETHTIIVEECGNMIVEHCFPKRELTADEKEQIVDVLMILGGMPELVRHTCPVHHTKPVNDVRQLN